MGLWIRHRPAVRIDKRDVEVLSIPSTPRRGIENIGRANRARAIGNQARALSLAAAAVWRPGPGTHRIVIPIADLNDVRVHAVAFGPLAHLILVGKAEEK